MEIKLWALFLSAIILNQSCGNMELQLDSVIASRSGTPAYTMNAQVNGPSLDDYSIIRQNEPIRPFLTSQTGSDPDLCGITVTVTTLEGDPIGTKIQYVLHTAAAEWLRKNNERLEASAHLAALNPNTSQEEEPAIPDTVFYVSSLDNKLPAFVLPDDLPIASYRIVFEAWSLQSILQTMEKPFFYIRDADFDISDIKSLLPGFMNQAHFIPVNTEVLLEAQIRSSPQLQPYIIWYQGRSSIGEGAFNNGTSQLFWTVPAQMGFQTIRAEVFPFRPQSSEMSGLVRELSLPISDKNVALGYFTQDADTRLNWFHFARNLHDDGSGADSSALIPAQSTSARWLSGKNTYGLSIGPDDSYSLRQSLFKNSLETEGKGTVSLAFKPLEAGTILSAVFFDSIQCSLSHVDGIFTFSLALGLDLWSSSSNVKPEDWDGDFITAALEFSIKKDSFLIKMTLGARNTSYLEHEIVMTAPLSGELLLQLGIPAVNPPTDTSIAIAAQPAADTAVAILDELSLSFDTRDLDRGLWADTITADLLPIDYRLTPLSWAASRALDLQTCTYLRLWD
ncbi:hypothetical protein ACYULU_08915 [Breznakiellaceae bacterium SP9]